MTETTDLAAAYDMTRNFEKTALQDAADVLADAASKMRAIAARFPDNAKTNPIPMGITGTVSQFEYPYQLQPLLQSYGLINTGMPAMGTPIVTPA